MKSQAHSTLNTQVQQNSRRVFMMQTIVGCAAVGTVLQAKAQAVLAETDPQAVALAYKADATKVDKTKQPKYAAGQVCSNCALYQAKAGSTTGGCPLFGAKQVAAKGWCNAWVKKG